MVDELDFDSLEPIRLPVKIQGKEYVLKEADGDAAAKYRNAVTACTTFGPEGNITSVRNIGDVEPLLVSFCLYDDQDKPVHLSKIKKWSSKIVKKLFDKAKEISDLDEGEPKERTALDKALTTEDAPIKLKALREYVDTLTDDEYKPLKKWLKPTAEELAKNEQSATADGSV